jgi:hypothetical protein
MDGRNSTSIGHNSAWGKQARRVASCRRSLAAWGAVGSGLNDLAAFRPAQSWTAFSRPPSAGDHCPVRFHTDKSCSAELLTSSGGGAPGHAGRQIFSVSPSTLYRPDQNQGRQCCLLLPKRAEVQNEVRDMRLQRQGKPRRRRHVADRLRAEGVDRRRRDKDRRAREESSELRTK